MNKKTANIIIQIFVAIWAILSVIILIGILQKDLTSQNNLVQLIQALISLVCSLWLFWYVRRQVNSQ